MLQSCTHSRKCHRFQDQAQMQHAQWYTSLKKTAHYLFVSFICSFEGIFFQSCVWRLKLSPMELCWSPIAYFAVIFQRHEPWQRQFFIKREKHSIGTSEQWKSLKQYHIVKPVKRLSVKESYLYFVTSINVQLLWLLCLNRMLHEATSAVFMHYLLTCRERKKSYTHYYSKRQTHFLTWKCL